MKRFIPILASIIILLFSQSIFAGSPPIKYGKVSAEELTMTICEIDSSAAAVILCDYGVFNSRDFEFKRILRIKILKKEGYQWANQLFPISSRIQDTYIRGVTLNFENGEIVKTKLKSESIYKEKVTEHFYRYRISMPAVKVGSVFDIEFTYPGLPIKWYFQQLIPIKLSSLSVPHNEYISFRKNFYGFEPLSESSNTKWIAEDMPAFKVEPYISSFENYITKVEFDILSISFPGYFYDDISTSWDEVAEYLDERLYFGVALRASGYLRSEAKALQEEFPEPSVELLERAFKLMKKFSWNERKSIYTSQESISYAYKDGIGNSADVNLALVQLLKKLDFKVAPVVLSTRDNGILSIINPSINKLNYVIARVELDDKEYLLDATDKYTTFDMLPERCLNWFGYQVDEDNSSKVILTPSKKEQKMIYSTLTLSDDLVLEGNIKITSKDYGALNFRNNYHSFSNEDDFLDDIIEKNPGLRITGFKVENLDELDMPIKEEYEVKIKNQLEEIDDQILFYPMVFNRLTKNPLRLEERKYPIDYGYKSSKTYIASITIPESLIIKSFPEMAIVKLPDNSANFTFQITQMGQTIQLVCKVNINQELFLESDYKYLQEWYNQILLKHAEPIVLERK